PHASADRGILMLPYRDRVLTTATDSYSASNFALCFLCHSEAPFRDLSGNNRSDTNFRLHGMHLNEIGGDGAGGTSIDTPGAGNGVAICAECHFRIHSTTFSVGSQGATSRLVNFAPNVTAMGSLNPLGANTWSVGNRTCTLTCHGQDHDGDQY